MMQQKNYPKFLFWNIRTVFCKFWVVFLLKHKFLESWASQLPFMFHHCKIMLFPWFWPTHGFHCYSNFSGAGIKVLNFSYLKLQMGERRLKMQPAQSEGENTEEFSSKEHTQYFVGS